MCCNIKRELHARQNAKMASESLLEVLCSLQSCILLCKPSTVEGWIWDGWLSWGCYKEKRKQRAYFASSQYDLGPTVHVQDLAVDVLRWVQIISFWHYSIWKLEGKWLIDFCPPGKRCHCRPTPKWVFNLEFQVQVTRIAGIIAPWSYCSLKTVHFRTSFWIAVRYVRHALYVYWVVLRCILN